MSQWVEGKTKTIIYLDVFQALLLFELLVERIVKLIVYINFDFIVEFAVKLIVVLIVQVKLELF